MIATARQVFRTFTALLFIAAGLGAFWTSPARAQFDLFGQKPGSSCPIGDGSTGNGRLLGSQLVPGNSNGDAERLALVREITGDQNAVQVACTFSPQDAQSGTWNANGESVTHILVKASTVQQVFAIADPPQTSGQWSTQCIANNGGNQPDVSGVFCYRSVIQQQQHTGTIKILKETVGGTGEFEFSLTGINTNEKFSLNTTNGSPASSTAFTVPAGNEQDYTATETTDLPPHWTLASIQCTSNQRASFSGNLNDKNVVIDNLQEGENVECTFTNQDPALHTGTIKILKETVGGTGEFEFSLTGINTNEKFSLNTTNGSPASSTAFTVPAGNEQDYTATETTDLPPHWTLASIQCTSNQRASFSGNLNDKNVVIDNLQEGENVECTFTNQDPALHTGTIKILKETVGGTGEFEFSLTGINTNEKFSLNTTNGSPASSTAFTVPAGNEQDYTATETTDLPPHWTLASIQCTSNQRASFSGNLNDKNVVIDNLQEGENVECTFTNQDPVHVGGAIIVKKVTIGGDGEFAFNLVGPETNESFQLMNRGQNSFNDLPVGSYTIEEASCPRRGSSRTSPARMMTLSKVAQPSPSRWTRTRPSSARSPTSGIKRTKEWRRKSTASSIGQEFDNLLTYGPDRRVCCIVSGSRLHRVLRTNLCEILWRSARCRLLQTTARSRASVALASIVTAGLGRKTSPGPRASRPSGSTTRFGERVAGRSLRQLPLLDRRSAHATGAGADIVQVRYQSQRAESSCGRGRGEGAAAEA